MTGAAETFDWLRAKGVKIALNTGFDRATTDLIIEAVGWGNGVADAIICWRADVTLGRPAPYLIFRSMEATGVTSVHKVMRSANTVLDSAGRLQCGRARRRRRAVGRAQKSAAGEGATHASH